MNFFLIILFWFGSSNSYSKTLCEYGKAGDCPANQYCIKIDKKKSLCKKVSIGELPIINFPFERKQEVTCNQGHLSPDGNSHTWNNTAFAKEQSTWAIISLQ